MFRLHYSCNHCPNGNQWADLKDKPDATAHCPTCDAPAEPYSVETLTDDTDYGEDK